MRPLSPVFLREAARMLYATTTPRSQFFSHPALTRNAFSSRFLSEAYTPQKKYISIRTLATKPATAAAPAKPKSSPLEALLKKIPQLRGTKKYSVSTDTKCSVEPVLSDYQSRSTSTALELASTYLRLGKHRLSFLVVFTAFVGHYMCHGGVLSGIFLATGTCLLSMSANGCNQVIERRVDALMNRTKMRPMVVNALSLPHALAVLTASAVAGSGILYFGCNPLTAFLGMFNWALYVMAYTPMKRYHWSNTWVGAFVGLLPPLMGVAAATGTIGMAGVFLGGVLYLWQIPHFMSLSYLCRDEYAAAGFQMLPSLDVKASANQAFLHSILLCGWCAVVLPCTGSATPLLTVETTALTAYMIFSSLQYRRRPSAETARSLFRFSILFLTLLMLLMMWHRSPQPVPLASFFPMLLTQLKPVVSAGKEVAAVVKKGVVKAWHVLCAASETAFYATFPSLAPQPKLPTWPPT